MQRKRGSIFLSSYFSFFSDSQENLPQHQRLPLLTLCLDSPALLRRIRVSTLCLSMSAPRASSLNASQ